jgi:hypothetical protein
MGNYMTSIMSAFFIYYIEISKNIKTKIYGNCKDFSQSNQEGLLSEKEKIPEKNKDEIKNKKNEYQLLKTNDDIEKNEMESFEFNKLRKEVIIDFNDELDEIANSNCTGNTLKLENNNNNNDELLKLEELKENILNEKFL